jgi:uroporphyrinogen-III synthase
MTSLHGKRVVITRAAAQAGELAHLLDRRGAVPLLYPCIAITPLRDTALLDHELMKAIAGDYDWLFLTSTNTVDALLARLLALGHAPGALERLHVAAVGSATAQAARIQLGLRVSLLPEDHQADGLAAAFQPTPGVRVLLPQADLARPALADALRGRGALVTPVIAYHTAAAVGNAALRGWLPHGLDAITFASASAVRHFVTRIAAEGLSPDDLGGTVIACIGPSTRNAAEASGLSVHVMPPVYTLPALVGSLEDHFGVQ